MDLENTEQCEVRCTCRAPLSSEHPTVLRTDLPEAALCRDLSWARCGAWAEFSGAYDVAIPKRVEPGGDTAKDLHAPQNFRTGWIHSFFPWRKRTPAAQIRNTVNPLLWFIKTITLVLPSAFAQGFWWFPPPPLLLRVVGLRTGRETQWRPPNLLSPWWKTQVDTNPNCLLLSYLYDLRNYSVWNISWEPPWLGTRSESSEIIFAKFILYIEEGLYVN